MVIIAFLLFDLASTLCFIHDPMLQVTCYILLSTSAWVCFVGQGTTDVFTLNINRIS